ncbi:MAG: RQC-minor-1 family DNA-binding protein [Pseudomonadota bacterium]
MSRKVRRVPVTLDPKGIKQLSDDEIRVILRAADELIFSGGRGLLARVLKGSRQKAVLEHKLDGSPAYGALSDQTLEKITAKIDWLIINGYFRIEYDYRLPLLVYGERGWAIERETYADELLEKLEKLLGDDHATIDLSWLTDSNPEVLRLVLGRIADSHDAKYLPALQRWKHSASRRTGYHIREAVRAIKGTNDG